MKEILSYMDYNHLATSLSYTLLLCILSKDGDGKPGVVMIQVEAAVSSQRVPVFAFPGPLGLQNQWFSPLQVAVD